MDIHVARRVWYVALGGVLLTGCPKEDEVPIAPTLEHCGSITASETWTARELHLVTCDILVDDAGRLTIEAGAQVRFARDTGIYVGYEGRGGTLSIAGTASSPVVMGPTLDPPTDPPMPMAAMRGQWRGIVVSEGATNASIRGLRMEGAGGRQVGASIQIEDTTVLLDDVTITRSEECGVSIADIATLDPASTAIHVSDAEWPACVDLLNADSLPATDSDYTGNDTDRVRVAGGTLATARTWEDLGVPYQMDGPLTVDGDEANPAMLTLQAGTTVLFEMSRSLGVHDHGGFATEGTEERPVVLAPSVDDGPGSWMGLGFSAGVPSARIRLRGLVIENAGHVPVPTVPGSALYSGGASVLVEGVSLRGSSVLGFRFTGGAGFAEGSRDLEVTGCAGIGILDAAAAHTFPEEGANLRDNETNAIEVEHGSVHEAVTWGNPGAPYLVRGTIFFDGTEEAPAILTVGPGTTIENAGGGLAFGAYRGPAGLMAVSTAALPITFTGRRSGVSEQERWDGLSFGDVVIDSMCRLENVDVGFGGANGFSATNVSLTGASPTLSYVFIHDSVAFGLGLDRNSMPSMSNVTYARNPSGDVTMR